MAADKDYGQLFCEAVDTLVKKRLEDISFDTTKVCTITSNNEAKNGKYRVKVLDGLSEFEAYTSDTELKVGQAVYVQIPSGDMNEQKFIIGKKTDDSDHPMSYTPPFASFINITGNLISNTEGVNGQLIATNIETEKEKNKEYKDAVTIWTYNIENTPLNISSDIGEPLSQYGLLGIQAQFRSWLKELQAEQGSYGLKLRVEAEEEDIADIVNLDEEEQEKYYIYIKATKYDAEEKYYIKNEEEQYEQVTESITEEQFAEGDYYYKERKVSYYDFELDCSEMIGDPYNFSSYYQQEKLFDISHIYQIRKMELQFYQKRDFFDRFGQPLKILDEPNLFVKDVIVSFGYDISEFDSDKVQIFSLDSPKYIPTNNPVDEANHKKLQLRWIHKDKNGKIAVVSENNNLDYKITWYKYRLGTYSHTPVSGADWMPMSVQFSDVRLGHIAYDGETYADSDALDSKGLIQKYNILDEEWKQYNQSAELGLARYPSENMTWLIPDITLPTESIKVVISYLENPNNENSRKYITSNVLTFENRKETVSKPTVDAVTALTIHCEDETDGNYLIYNLANELLDSGQSKTERTFTAYFRNAPLQNADYIEWIIPKTNSMLVMDEFYKAPNFSNEVLRRKDFEGKKNNEDPNDPNFYHIYRFGDVNNKYDISHANTQRYKIRSSYDPGRTNNTIQCKVMKDKITYTAVLDLAFGQAGTSGSDHTLRIKYEDPNITGIVAPPKGIDANVLEYKFEAELTNFSGERIDLNSVNNYELEWSLITTKDNEKYDGDIKKESETKGLLLYTHKNENDQLVLANNSNAVVCRTQLALNIEQIYILQAKLKWRGTAEEGDKEILTSYFPIVLKKDITNNKGKEQIEDIKQYDEDGNEIILTRHYYHDYIDIKGPDRVVYQADGGLPIMTRDNYVLRKNKYVETNVNVQELSSDNSIIWRQIDIEEEKNAVWKIFKPEYETITDKDSDEAENLLKLYPTINSKNYLAPLPFYIEDSPLCAVQAIVNEEIVWTQPLLIIMNKYPNGAVNRWDGNGLVLNKEEGTIIGSAMAVGKKNGDNTFSGVMLGAWEGKAKEQGGVSQEITESTGVYGFHYGQISYAFKDDGTAFIGKSGHGRIYFDGNNGSITSGNYVEGTPGSGMKIELEKGHIDAYNFSLNSHALTIDSGIDGYDKEGNPIYSGTLFDFHLDINNNSCFKVGTAEKTLLEISDKRYLLQSLKGGMSINLNDGYIEADKFTLEVSDDAGTITITSEDDNTPLSIVGKGDKGGTFKVNWDGSVIANNAYLKGTIAAIDGMIGDWYIREGRLEGGNLYVLSEDKNGKISVVENKEKGAASSIILDSKNGKIMGGLLSSTTKNPMFLSGDFVVTTHDEVSYNPNAFTTYGHLSAIGSNTGNSLIDEESTGIGMWTDPLVDGKKTTSVVKATNANAGIAYGDYSISIEHDGIHFYTNQDPNKQHGIYARFA